MGIAVFLRGINVNGIRIKMDELRKIIRLEGYTDVKTIQASGNIVLSDDVPKASIYEHKKIIEKAIANYFHYETFIFLKTSNQLSLLLDEAKNNYVSEGFNHYTLLSENEKLSERLNMEFRACKNDEGEQLILGQYGIYWIVEKGRTLKSEFGRKVLGKKEFKDKLTSRAIATIEKVYAKMQREQSISEI